jgi:hypothetical protein
MTVPDIVWAVEPYDDDTRHCGMQSGCFKLATACFDVWNANELTTTPHTYGDLVLCTPYENGAKDHKLLRSFSDMMCHVPLNSDYAYLEVECKG